jgi:hypothetical protein
VQDAPETFEQAIADASLPELRQPDETTASVPTHPEVWQRISEPFGEARTAIDAGKHEVDNHRESLSRMIRGPALDRAVEHFVRAATLLSALTRQVAKEEREFLPIIAQLNEQYAKCELLAAWTKAYGASPKSLPPTPDTLMDLFRKGELRCTKQPSINKDSRKRYFIEIQMDFEPVKVGDFGMRLQPLFLHIHLQPARSEPTLSRISKDDLMPHHGAITVKTQRYRRKLLDEHGSPVPRTVVSREWAYEVFDRVRDTTATPGR